MRIFVSLFVVCCLGYFVPGCDRPTHEPAYYGKVVDQLPDIPEAKESFDLPEIEGVDRDEFMKRR